MNNGRVVVERLQAMETSLQRALEGVQAELRNRDEYAEYQDTYLSELSRLRMQTETLEDQIRVKLNYA